LRWQTTQVTVVAEVFVAVSATDVAVAVAPVAAGIAVVVAVEIGGDDDVVAETGKRENGFL
jgi:hypothetical protein